MLLRFWRVLAIVLTSLALTMESAHVLELPQKLNYSAELYSAVNTTLYRYFAIVGGVYQIASIVVVLVLAFLVRHRGRPFRWTLASAVLLAAAFGVWLAIVEPVNGQIAEAMEAAPTSVPLLWTELRGRWEYGHAIGFVVQLIGLCLLACSVVADTPLDPPRHEMPEEVPVPDAWHSYGRRRA